MTNKFLSGAWRAIRSGGLSPLFLALWPVLSLYHQNAAECPPGAVLRSLATMGGIGTIAILAFRVLFNDRAIASVHASFFVLVFAGGGAFFAAIDRRLAGFPVGTAAAELVALLALLAAYLGLLRSARPPVRRWWASANTVLAVGAASLCFSTALLGIAAAGRKSPGAGTTIEGPARVASPDAPDVYLILLDGYGRADVLKDVLAYDNTPFLRELAKRGFWVAPRGRSNFPTTPDAVATLLNLDYAEGAAGAPSNPRAMIQHNRFQALAREAGYVLYSFDSGWLITSSFPLSDVEIRSLWRLNEFERSLVDVTVLGKLFPLIVRGDQRGILERNLRELRALPERPGQPKCVVAHIVLPHPPYLFDAAGNVPRHTSDFNLMGPWKEPDGYIDQLRFLNARLLEAIDAIVAHARVPPLILLVSDHGSCFRGRVGADDEKLVAERTGILLAVAAPPAQRALFYDSITPVNAVRLLAGSAFGRPQPPVDDRVYWNAENIATPKS